MDFNKALAVKASAVEKPPLPPIGHYIFQISKKPEIKESETSSWSSINFQCQAVGVFEDADDVDADDLKKFGGVKNVQTRYSFMFNDEDETQQARSLFYLKEFLVKQLGLEDTASLMENLSASINKRFVGKLRHRPDKNKPEDVYAEIEKTAAVE
jgi:hypothetical protein